ncbi:MAG: hypothetical protein IJD86_08555 [Clostridia bacterium]|nr:hypothetical protein [Clostridia bacterium]
MTKICLRYLKTAEKLPRGEALTVGFGMDCEYDEKRNFERAGHEMEN